jgi:hypothetical protein
MITPPWHEFLDGSSNVLHIDRPATPAVDPVTAAYAVSFSGGARTTRLRTVRSLIPEAVATRRPGCLWSTTRRTISARLWAWSGHSSEGSSELPLWG